MSSKEEIYTQQLYQDLQKKLSPNFFYRILGRKKPIVTIEQKGTQHKCRAAAANRQCEISCSHIDRTDLKYKGPEYFTRIQLNGKNITEGRTFDKDKTLEAVKFWLQNKTIEELYVSFSFVDEEKRQLEKIRTVLLETNPRPLHLPEGEIITDHFGVSSLWFTYGNRAARIYFFGYDPQPHYVFYWDDTTLFETSGLTKKRLDTLVAKWVFDKENPSVLKKEFPEITFGALAAQYENEKETEGAFILSWDKIEFFYHNLESENKEAIIRFIKKMRRQGFDKTLRAGQSLYHLILSRSLHHGLREEQPSISFTFDLVESQMMVRTHDNTEITFESIEYNDIIKELLKKLEATTID